jgi:type IV pilus assembly protein PilC
MIMAFASFLAGNAAALGIAAIALTGASIVFFRSANGKWLASNARLTSSIYRQGVNLRITQSLSLLLSSGQPLAEAVAACADTDENIRVRRDIRSVASGLAEGRAFWELLSEIRYIDPLFISMARVGEETGRLPLSLEKCEQSFEHMQSFTIRRLNKLIEPAITIILGLLLGVVMLSVILPAFSLTEII